MLSPTPASNKIHITTLPRSTPRPSRMAASKMTDSVPRLEDTKRHTEAQGSADFDDIEFFFS